MNLNLFPRLLATAVAVFSWGRPFEERCRMRVFQMNDEKKVGQEKGVQRVTVA